MGHEILDRFTGVDSAGPSVHPMTRILRSGQTVFLFNHPVNG